MPSASVRGLQGPRPHPLKVSKDSWKAGKQLPSAGLAAARLATSDRAGQTPVIVYLHSPKVIHANPQEFMSLVQRLTGKDSGDSPESGTSSGSGSGSSARGRRDKEEKKEVEEDPLLLTLGQSPSAPSWALAPTSTAVSPVGLFLSSPSFNGSFQEFGSLF
ncbi:hypothetical protein HPP92_000981 [Vanilla planifolia]|uniref:VQ domain-containing protein n=1 Tax=Vanilla planifolia TaxID=51239 RepID=A0A835RXE0_VANPL|nr:hypothetical protein HPP92_000981 [Vanilla planifolia]